MVSSPSPSSRRHPASPRQNDEISRSRYLPEHLNWVLLILCFWSSLCCGMLYLFPAMQTRIMRRCQYSAADVDSVYSAGQLGVGLSFLPGFIFQFYGCVPAGMYSMFFLTVGTLGLTQGLAPHVVTIHGVNGNGGNGSVNGGNGGSSGGNTIPAVPESATGHAHALSALGHVEAVGIDGQQADPSALIRLLGTASDHERILIPRTLEKTAHCYAVDHLAFFFFCFVAGSSALFKVALFSGMKLVDKSRVGFVGGILAAGYGLSAAFWNVIFVHVFEHSVVDFIGFVGVLFSATALVAMFALRLEDDFAEDGGEIGGGGRRDDKGKGSFQRVGSGIRDEEGDDGVPERTKNGKIGNGIQPEVVGTPLGAAALGGSTVELAPIFSDHSTALGGQDGKKTQSKSKSPTSPSRGSTPTGDEFDDDGRRLTASITIGNSRTSSRSPTNSQNLSASQKLKRKLSITTKQELSAALSSNWSREPGPHWKSVLKAPAFYAVLLQFLIVEGIGSGFYIGNLKLLAGSCGYTLNNRDLLVSYFSIANCCGRVVFGYLADLTTEKVGWFLLFPLLMMLPLVPMIVMPTITGEVVGGTGSGPSGTGTAGEQSQSSSYEAPGNDDPGSLFGPLSFDFCDTRMLLISPIAYGGAMAVLPVFMIDEYEKKNMVWTYVVGMFLYSVAVRPMSALTGGEYDRVKEEMDSVVSQATTATVTTTISAAGDDYGGQNYVEQDDFCHPIGKCFEVAGQVATSLCLFSFFVGLCLVIGRRRKTGKGRAVSSSSGEKLGGEE